MNDRAVRIGLLLGVIPTVFYIGWFSGLLTSDGRISCSCAVLTVCWLTLWIWRPYVRWTRGAVLRISAVTLVLFGQILMWRPMWATTGCGKDAYDNIQCFSQSAILLAVWCVGCALSWWGAQLWRRSRRHQGINPSARLKMTPNIVRLSIGLALIPFLPGLFFLLAITLETRAGLSIDTSMFVAYETCAVIAVCVWILLWRKSVKWTLPLIGRTAFIATPILVTPIGVYWSSGDQVLDFLYRVSPVLALGVWLAGTSLAWRRPAETLVAHDSCAVSPFCPSCAYNLTGLREVRCPECGWASTVDDIVQRHLAIAVLTD